MDILNNAALTIQELAESENIGFEAPTLGFIGHYIPFGAYAELKVTYNYSANDYLKYSLSIQGEDGLDAIEDGQGIDIPESILKLAKMVKSPASKRKEYNRPKTDIDIDIVFHMIYSCPSNTPLSPENLMDSFYTIFLVTYQGGEEKSEKEEDYVEASTFILPNSWWAEARLMTPNLKVYNTLDFATFPMQILSMHNKLLKAYCQSNPLKRLVGSDGLKMLMSKKSESANRYLFIPTNRFLRQRVQNWLYHAKIQTEAQ
jgi:hypothetical protein